LDTTTRGSSNQYHVFRVRNVASGSPTLATLTLTGAAYAIPPAARQPGTTTLIDTGDNRMLQVAGIANNVIGTFTTSCNFTSATPNESCSLTPRVVVGQNGSGGLTATIAENTFSGVADNIFVHHNSIATNTAFQSATVWVSSGTSRFDTSTALVKNVNAGWTSVSNFAPGTCALTGGVTARSGDYTGVQLDPSDSTGFWLAGEETIPISGSCQWQTRVAHVLP